jgi:hypothetical protein
VKISEFAQYVEDLAKFLDLGGGKAVAGELRHIAKCLVPFHAQNVKAFTDALLKLEKKQNEGDSTGGARTTKSTTSKFDLDTVRKAIVELYARSANPNLTKEEIDQEMAKLEGGKKTDLVSICQALNLLVKGNATIPQIKELIKKTIVGRWGTARMTNAMGTILTDPNVKDKDE